MIPKWVLEIPHNNCGDFEDRLIQALTIAIEALETWPVCEARRHCACSNFLAYRKKALAEIERMGEK